MNLTVDRLKELFVKLGGAESVVAGCSTIVEVLNAISAKYDGKDDATLNPDAISNITEIADKIGGGGDAPIGALIADGITSCVNLSFSSSGITSVIVPGTVKEVFGFNSCPNLKTVVVKRGVETIGVEAFSACTNLENLTLEDGLTIILDAAFNSCSKLQRIETDAKTIGDSAFMSCTRLGKVVLKEGVEAILNNAFVGSGLTFNDDPGFPREPLILPSTINYMDDNALQDVFVDVKCRFSADSPVAANAPWGAVGNVIFDYTGD